MQIKNRENIPKAPRFPDPKLPAETFNRAVVEIVKQQYKEIVVLRDRVNQLGRANEKLESRFKQTRPAVRYCDII